MPRPLTLFLVTLGVLLGFAPTGASQGTPVGFLEEFALAEDRGQALARLVPGTDDHYYYACLYHQGEGRLDEVDGLLGRWRKEGRSGGSFKQIEARQALLRASTDPEATYKFLERELGLRFNERRRVSGESPNLATRLDPDAIDTSRLLAKIVSRGRRRNLDGIEPSMFERLVRVSLTKEQAGVLLERLERPDVPGLVELILRDLRDNPGSSFGSRKIHAKLLLDQLEQLRAADPNLLGNGQYVNAVMLRLAPGVAESMDDPTDERAYLERTLAFVRTLPSAFNSLKAHVLFRQLEHDLDHGEPDQGRLLEYLRLPRPVYYFPRRQDRKLSFANLNQDFDALASPFRAIGNEEPIVVESLQRIFRRSRSFDGFRGALEERFLLRVWGETKLLYGADGDPETYLEMLGGAGAVEALKNRVEIDFARSNRSVYGPDESVTLDVNVKNVDTLLLKVFQVDPVAYFDRYGRDVSSTIDLDGLVANYEETLRYDAPPLRRVRRTLTLDPLSRAGTYVVELIGNGVSSRAVVRKGSLHLLERISAAGHVFRVLGQDREPVQGVVLRMGGRDFLPEDAGIIRVPFTTAPGSKRVLLRAGGVASVVTFDHLGEAYTLEAGVHTPREALLAGQRASFVVRPRLTLNGERVALSVLEDPVLEIRATTQDGTESTKVVDGLELSDTGDLLTEIQVPERARTFQVALRGTVRSLTSGDELSLGAEGRVFEINRLEGMRPRQAVLTRTLAGYALDVLGRGGEIGAGVEVSVRLKHHGFTSWITRQLMTDERGRVALGPLENIDRLDAGIQGEARVAYDLSQPLAFGVPMTLHARTGAAVRVPYTGSATTISRDVASLLRRTGSVSVSDHFGALALENGYLVARGLEAADYTLTLKESGEARWVRVVDGDVVFGHIVDERRALEATSPVPLQILRVAVEDQALVAQLGGATGSARVHVFVSRTVDPFDATADLALGSLAGAGYSVLAPGLTTYESGRAISDEYRYILDRRLIEPYPGNMLQRPGYLLNPWVVSDTQDEMQQEGREGGAYRGPADSMTATRSRGRGGRRRQADGGDGASLHILDFLARGAVLLSDLRPDENGRVRIPLEALGAGHILRIVAVDDDVTVAREIVRAERPLERRERRLADPLDPATPMTQQRRIAFVDTGESIVIRDAPNAGAQTFETIADVFQLFRTMASGDELGKFDFLTRWPGLDDTEKRAKYSEFVCHELNAFLREKDPAFFRAVVRPYMVSKGHRTFMDDWLLDEDVSGYLAAARFERLNVVEKILLLKKESGSAERLADDLLAMVPRGTFSIDDVFASVLASGDLDADRGGLTQALDETRREVLSRKRKAGIGRPGGGGGGGGGPATPGPAGPPASGAISGARARPDTAKLESSNDDFFLGDVAEAESQDAPVALGRKLSELGYAGEGVDFEADARARDKSLGFFYRDLAATQQYAETHYWRVPLRRIDAGLITVSPFWADFARADGSFVSTSFPLANRSVNEMLLALAFLDLPFEAKEHTVTAEGRSVEMTAASPMLLALEDIAVATPDENAANLLVGQDFFRVDRRTAVVDGVEVERFVRDEFIAGVPYGCRIVITNPTPGPVELQALLQIPEGAIALGDTHVTRGVPLTIGAYGTEALETLFYFPAAGDFSDFPVHAGRGSVLLGAAEAQRLNVVVTPTSEDQETWDWVSQNAEMPALIAFLDAGNPRALDLSKIAWRMGDRDAFDVVTAALARRNVTHPTLWKYGVRHRDARATRTFLSQNQAIANRVGAPFASPLLDLDPRERAEYEHLAYEPLVNGRTHEFGGERRILNREFAGQYERFLRTLALGAERTDEASMELSYYLLLQDRIGEALNVFATVDRGAVRTGLQYDYMTAYMAFFRGDVAAARTVATQYAEHPVDRWRARFGEVLAQADEIEGRATSRDLDPEDREGSQGALAGSEPLLTLAIEDGEVRLTHERIEQVEVRYHRMDVEFLFSNSPFVRGGEGAFGLIQPNRVDVVAIDSGTAATAFAIPAELQSANVVVEVRSAGLARRTTYFAGDLAVQGMERYGQVRVTAGADVKPLPRAYVKVYARLADGSTRFHKDGYTDLRGRFDYVSLSGVSGPDPDRYAVLVMHGDAGATITELAPPAR